jgi:NAD(P)H-dependent flavin oxidoreductase YrpB (nitropropane dioxygenase family)
LAHSIEVAAAISRAGGLGVYAAARDGPSELAGKLRPCAALCPDHPLAVDLLLPTALPEHTSAEAVAAAVPQGHRDFVQGLFRAPACRRPPRATSSRNTCARKACLKSSWTPCWPAMWRCLPPAWARRRGAGTGQGQQASTPWCPGGHPRHAAKAIDAGADILVAQGHDAGGHTGPIGTFSWCRRSLACAGGSPGDCRRRHWLRGTGGRVLALGAQGAWLGTVWLGTREHALPPALVAKLMAAGSEDTVITRAHSGKPCRVVRSAFSDAWAETGAPEPLDMPYQQALIGELLAAVEAARGGALAVRGRWAEHCLVD